jgi:hydroxylamine dehydrogenase
MSFRGVFIAVVVSTALIVSAFLVNARRPGGEARITPALTRATGKCADCHRHETSAVVREYDMSRHNAANVNCLDCHQPTKGQETLDHKGFEITKKVTASNCVRCHPDQYEQYLKSRHSAPAWGAVAGKKDFTPEQIAAAEAIHKGAVDRDPNMVAELVGISAVNNGCKRCHDVGKPNEGEGTIGTCTACHARHVSSVELARTPETCGQCHMGPDHSQIEIYHESKHGVLYNAQRSRMNLAARPSTLSTDDMPVPTCATCHMSGMEGKKSTHDTSERLSYYLFATVSDRRPTYAKGKANMKAVCLVCHTNPPILKFFGEAENVVKSTNKLIQEAEKIITGLRKDKLLTPAPLDEAIEFVYFELWHHDGRAAKHGAFMGGADFVQWHGFYEIQSKMAKLREMAAELRKANKPVAAEPAKKVADRRVATP